MIRVVDKKAIAPGKYNGALPKKVWGAFYQPEIAVFADIIQTLAPKRYFEFGTGCGLSVQLVKQILPLSDCWTIDKDDFRIHRDANPSLGPIPDAHFWTGNTYTHPLPVKLFGTMDVVLVDADHYLPSVASDTGRAMDLVSQGGTILWHDVLQKPHTTSIEVWEYLDKWFPEEVSLIAETQLAYWKRP